MAMVVAMLMIVVVVVVVVVVRGGATHLQVSEALRRQRAKALCRLS
jgi:hypothetical protein